MAVLEAVTAGWTVRVLIRQLFRKGSDLLLHSTCLTLNDANFCMECKGSLQSTVYWKETWSAVLHLSPSCPFTFKGVQRSAEPSADQQHWLCFRLACSLADNCCQIAGSSTEFLNLFSLSFAGPLTYFDIGNIGNPCLTSLLMYFVG